MEILLNEIPVEPLLKEFHCSVCLNLMEDCFLTKCGHSFCKACILEAINRHHRCPACQEVITENDCYRNIAMNNLKRTILEEEKKAKSVYIDQLQGRIGANNENGLEQVLVDCLKDHIILFKNRFNEIKANFDSTKAQIQKNENDATQTQLQALEDEFREVEKYLTNSLKDHLKSVVPSPDMLNVVCSLSLPQKDIVINNVSIQPYKKVASLKEIIITEVQKSDLKISSMNENLGFIIIVPPEKKTVCQELNAPQLNLLSYKDFDQYILKAQNFGLQCIKINSPNILSSYNICPFSTLIYVGDIKFKEDKPECLTYNYQAGTVTNYLSCENCNTNWICQTCAEYCHKGHSLVPHLTNKKTTWACCYCVKNHLCKALNKDNKK